MATLADSLIQQAGQAADAPAQGAGLALQAYHVVSTAQNARQQLEIQKEENERNKGNWVIQQLQGISALPPQTQGIAIDAFNKQAAKLYPGFNPDIGTALKKDSDMLQGTLRSFASQHGQDPDVISNFFGSDLPTAKAHVEKTLELESAERAASLKAQGYMTTKQEQVDYNVHKSAVDSVVNDKSTNNLLTTMQNLQQAKQNFLKGGATAQEFNELQQAVRSNLGIKGNGGVGEREATYLKELGIDVGSVNQFITGNLADVTKSAPEMANQIMKLVDLETANKQRLGLQQIDKNSLKYGSFYKRPSMQAHYGDFQNTVQAQKDQFLAASGGAGGSSQVPVPGGAASSQAASGQAAEPVPSAAEGVLGPQDWRKQRKGGQ